MKFTTDLEGCIHNVASIKDLLRIFVWRYADHPSPMTEDEVINHIMGIEYMLDMVYEKLFDEYKKVNNLDEYATEEQKAHREKVLTKLFKEKGKKK